MRGQAKGLRDAARTVLRGRGPGLNTLHECLRRARAGSGSVVLVQGSAGSGMSRLLQEAAVAATRTGFRSGIGRAVQGDQSTPSGPLLAAVLDGPEALLPPARVSGSG